MALSLCLQQCGAEEMGKSEMEEWNEITTLREVNTCSFAPKSSSDIDTYGIQMLKPPAWGFHKPEAGSKPSLRARLSSASGFKPTGSSGPIYFYNKAIFLPIFDHAQGDVKNIPMKNRVILGGSLGLLLTYFAYVGQYAIIFPEMACQGPFPTPD
ncbi:hypothetical protein L218DRAFT_947325 [Marasmius fiardii PR-910]|nr:hypothetical protein L218DRAFT_947325 [Marasmius fiardii PR-910]